MEVKDCLLTVSTSGVCREAPNERLGAMADGFKSVRKHRWFKTMDWPALAARLLPPPLVPSLDGENDMRYAQGRIRWKLTRGGNGTASAAHFTPLRLMVYPHRNFEKCEDAVKPKTIGSCDWDADF